MKWTIWKKNFAQQSIIVGSYYWTPQSQYIECLAFITCRPNWLVCSQCKRKNICNFTNNATFNRFYMISDFYSTILMRTHCSRFGQHWNINHEISTVFDWIMKMISQQLMMTFWGFCICWSTYQHRALNLKVLLKHSSNLA